MKIPTQLLKLDSNELYTATQYISIIDLFFAFLLPYPDICFPAYIDIISPSTTVANPMILRFRSKDGMARVTVNDSDLFGTALDSAVAKFTVPNPQELYVSNAQSEKGMLATELAGKSVLELNLKNGDMIFLTYGSNVDTKAASAVQNAPKTVAGNVSVSIDAEIPAIVGAKAASSAELPIDQALDREDGLIPRTRSTFCRHGDKGMCEYCSPLPPWDKAYLAEKGIKHKSFHSYVKELDQLQNPGHKASLYIAPLVEPNYSINLQCSGGHAPYPQGICSKCQPAPITLLQQPFRMVDHVEFAEHSLLNNFIDTWRQAGTQRYGILYGHYEKFDKVPLGIKAVVEAIYEPPQSGELDGITLLDWDDSEVTSIAHSLGLLPVGCVFTDLTDAGARNGSVLCKRHKESYFMSCVEVMMAARNQKKHPNITHHASSGHFLSKYVTCVVTGNLHGEIEPRAYQVSASAEALVAADDICASTQANMLYVNKTEGRRYVPDVFYSQINEYGLEVKTNAKPAFPVDYLLVTLLDLFPLEPTPRFIQNFPIENRDFLGELQDLKAVARQLLLAKPDGSHLCDFHFMVYLRKMAVLSPEEYALAARYVRDRNYADYMQLVETGGWMTLLTIVEQSV